MKNSANSIIISIGIFLMGCAISLGLFNIKSDARSVSVKGLCEIEKPANHVIWPIAYTEISNDLQVIYTNLENKNKIVTQFLFDNGITADEFSLGAPAVVDKNADQYRDGSNVGFRYIATQVITISSSKVDKIRELIVKQTVLLKHNVALKTSWEYPTQFMFTDIESVKPEMVEKATKNARVTAEKFAQDSESKLGKIISASQGQMSIEDRDQDTPYIKRLRIVTSIQYSLED